jgi:cell division septation protein DedD
MKRSLLFMPAALLLSVLLPSAAAAQQAAGPSLSATVSAAMDRQISRARALLESGEGADARNLLDSLVQAAPSASFDLAEALYWRAVLAERMGDAERDWKRLVIESPLSPRAADALVRLGELDLLRGRPAEARVYLERVLREFPTGVQRAKSALLVARTWFDERQDANGCAALAALQAEGVPEGELKMQASDLGRRCTGANAANASAANASAANASAVNASVASAPAAKAPATNAPPSNTTTDSRPAEAPSARPANARYSVQLAAFDTRREAEAAVARLAKAGVESRVDGNDKPFRVRHGYFATRTAANAQLAALKKRGHAGFIAELTP